MDQHDEVKNFLRTRRARITPDQVGFVIGGHRRVPGLRREEVALLAGVSVDYYSQIERGDLGGVSDEILDALARALRLDETETSHLFNLAHSAEARLARRQYLTPDRVRPSLQWYLDDTAAPVWIRNEPMDLVATNSLGRALYSPLFDNAQQPANNARFVFLDEQASRRFYTDWEQGADDIVATLRAYTGEHPHDKALTGLIGELVTHSEAFRTRWAAHNVRHHRIGIKRIRHPVVGDLELHYEALDLPSDPGWHMFALSAQPGSPTDERLGVLASWASTLDHKPATADQNEPPETFRDSNPVPHSHRQ